MVTSTKTLFLTEATSAGSVGVNVGRTLFSLFPEEEKKAAKEELNANTTFQGAGPNRPADANSAHWSVTPWGS